MFTAPLYSSTMLAMQNLTDDELKTIDAYNSNTDAWAASHDDVDFWKNELSQFKKLLPKGKILEIGVGSGRDAGYFISDENYSYLGTDVTENLIKHASARHPNAVFKPATIYDVNQYGLFDGIWCAAVLLHIPRKRLPEALGSLNSALNENGVCFVSTKLGHGEGLEPYNADKSRSRLIVYYEHDELLKACNHAGFELLWESQITERHNVWQSFILKKLS